MNESDGLYPIRTVASMTGVNPVTLRAWERRYGLITPQRTPTGHRLYSASEIERVHRVLALLREGIPVSQVGPLLDRRSENDEETTSAPQTVSERGSGPIDQAWRDSLQSACARFDGKALQGLMADALSQMDFMALLERVLLPTYLHMAAQQTSGELAAARFLAEHLRVRLGERLNFINPEQGEPLLLAGCPGHRDAVSLLRFGLHAAQRGWQVVYLGADTPLRYCRAALETSGARALVLFAQQAPPAAVQGTELPQLIKDAATPVVIAGAWAHTQSRQLRNQGATLLTEEPASALAQIHALL